MKRMGGAIARRTKGANSAHSFTVGRETNGRQQESEVDCLARTMSSHTDRMRDHMGQEAQRLRDMAKTARLFDHKGNRGSEAEDALTKWLRQRFSPDYTVSAGEIIDSFDTNASIDSRQQDAVLHANSADANRFLLPSGRRLLPVESVVAAIEIKLSVDAAKFHEADSKAREVAQLHLRASRNGDIVLLDEWGNRSVRSMSDAQRAEGVAVSDDAFLYSPVVFALFAFESDAGDCVSLSRWLDDASTISLVCCMDTGCVYRGVRPFRAVDQITESDGALPHFIECLVSSIGRYEAHVGCFKPDYGAYAIHKPVYQYARSQGGGIASR